MIFGARARRVAPLKVRSSASGHQPLGAHVGTVTILWLVRGQQGNECPTPAERKSKKSTQVMWDANGEAGVPASEGLDFDELSEEQQEAASIIG